MTMPSADKPSPRAERALPCRSLSAHQRGCGKAAVARTPARPLYGKTPSGQPRDITDVARAQLELGRGIARIDLDQLSPAEARALLARLRAAEAAPDPA